MEDPRQGAPCLASLPHPCTAAGLQQKLSCTKELSTSRAAVKPRRENTYEITSKTIWAELLSSLLKSSPQLIPFRGLCSSISLLTAPARSMRRHDPFHGRIAVHSYSCSISFVTDLRLFLEALNISKGHLLFLLRRSIFLCLIERFKKKIIFLLSINMLFC